MLGFSPLASAPLAATGSTNVQVVLSGVVATGSIFPVDVIPGTGVTVTLTGVQGDCVVNPNYILVWSNLDPDVDSDWNPITVPDDDTWNTIVPTGGKVYTEIDV